VDGYEEILEHISAFWDRCKQDDNQKTELTVGKLGRAERFTD
jgi:hypothetical protein